MSENKEGAAVKHYKFKELKVYASTEWLADNKKKYRQVFDLHATSYIYAELTMYNRNFDRENWEVNVVLKCYELKGKRKEVCNLEFNRNVSKFDNILYIREGWGNKREGSFWKRGSYYWEAWVDGEKVSTKYFYVEDAGQELSHDYNPYFELDAVKLYEGQFDDVITEERRYYKQFSATDSRYIHAEVHLANANPMRKWYCELFIKFYNEARELKGQINKLVEVKKNTESIYASAGWGSNTPGSWRKGNYTVELVFMDQLIGVAPFTVGEGIEEGIPDIKIPHRDDLIVTEEMEALPATYEEVIDRFDNMIGLTEVKTKVAEHAEYIKFLQLRKARGFVEKEDINIHSVFMGNPGTGKTTVAKMMGQIYKHMGLLSKGHVHEVDRVDLVGEYIGQTAPKVKEAIKKAKGGVLFIDEAYALARSKDDSKDFGREVIEILVKEMSNGTGDISVVVAGYPKEMKHFVDSNPGLRSRFKHFFEFKDYLPQELIRIADLAAIEKEVKLTEEARILLEEVITDEYRKRDKTFGNGRYVYDLVEKAKMNLGLRVMGRKAPEKLAATELSLIQVKDIDRLKAQQIKQLPDIPVDDKLLELALDELNSLIGISTVKTQIAELINIVRYHKKAGRAVVSSYSLHTVFVGNPGTGKTTVARILTKIYKALGILERGHMVETDRQGLVAGFIGQTAIKTAERLDEAMGGVLFIDEAYALSSKSGMQWDYGSEAIQTILKRMEDERGNFFLFVAGYPGNMEAFLKANPGLKSRFDKTLNFEDYTADQLHQIALKMIKDEGMSISKKASTAMAAIMLELYSGKDKFFGNARTVRKIVLEIIKNQNLRLSQSGTTAKRAMGLITYEDIQEITTLTEDEALKVEGIGFRRTDAAG